MVRNPNSHQPKAVKVLHPRRCHHCRAIFVPRNNAGKNAKFCCDAHRKAYWSYGSLPFDKMKEGLMREVRKIVPGLVHEELASLGIEVDPATRKQKLPKPQHEAIMQNLEDSLMRLRGIEPERDAEAVKVSLASGPNRT